MKDSIYTFFRKVQRMCWWGWKMRNSYDWDFGYLYETIGFKLERMIKEFRKNGHCQWNSSPEGREFKRLLEARELANRLTNGEVNSKATEFLEKYTKNENPDSLFNQIGIFENAKVIDKKLYSYMFKKAWEKDAAEINEQKKRFFYLMEKYSNGWWD